MANLGAQAGSGFDASDLTTGTLGNTVQDNITRLGTVTTGTFNGTIGSSATGEGLQKNWQTFYLPANITVSATSGNKITTWKTNAQLTSDAPSGTTGGIVGAGDVGSHLVTHNSGNFTFSQTGIYLMMLWTQLWIGGSSYIGMRFKRLPVGGSTSEIGSWWHYGANGDGGLSTIHQVLDITTSGTGSGAIQYWIEWESNTTGTIYGGWYVTQTVLTFVRLGDT